MIRKTINVIGRIFIGSGIVVLLFSAYQLWGTGILESHSQQTLRTTIDHALSKGELAKGSAEAHQVAKHPVPLPSGPTTLKLAPIIAAPAPGTPVGIIQIPAIGLNQVVVEGVGTPDLRQGPGHYPGTPLPGEEGNSAIAGHRTTYGHPFYNLNNVSSGTQIVITTSQGVFVYAAVSNEVVSPSDTAVLASSNEPILTLTTCNPRYSASQRLIVKAELVKSDLFGPGGPPHSTPTSTSTSTSTTTKPPAQLQPSTDDLAGQGQSNDFLPAVLWALATLACGFVVWLLARRFRRRAWLVYLGGTVVVLVVLFFFFTAVSPLLPASF